MARNEPGDGALALGARLPPERAGREAPVEVQARRRAMAAALTAGAWRVDADVEEVAIAGVRALRFRPRQLARGLVLHLHGGGFRLGCPEMSGPYAAALAERCAVEVVCPAYRLAPEHPFPAGLADACAVFAALARDAGQPLIVGGDSAGGGLAAGLTAILAQAKAAPRGLVLISPWLDLTATSPAYLDNAATDPLFSLEAAQAAAELYLQGHSAADPLASPLFADAAGFPPTLISVGGEEVLADDSRRFHDRLRTAGVPARLHAVAGMEHVAVTRDLRLPGAAETLEMIAEFIGALTAVPPPAGPEGPG